MVGSVKFINSPLQLGMYSILRWFLPWMRFYFCYFGTGLVIRTKYFLLRSILDTTYLALIMVQIFNPNKRPNNNNEMICMKQFCVHRTPEYILRPWHVQYGGGIRSSTSIIIISTVRYSIVLYNNLYNAWLVQSFSPQNKKDHLLFITWLWPILNNQV